MIRLMRVHHARVVVFVAVVAAVLVVASVVVTAVLRPSESQAAITQTVAETVETVPLRFQPVPGTKRTVRLVTTTTVSEEGAQAKDSMTGIGSYVFDLQAMEPAEDGTSVIDVSISSIHMTAIAAEQVSVVYDSTKPPVEDDERSKSCSSLVANRFTVRVSPKGEVLDAGLDGLFLAGAERRAKDEDDALRKKLDETADRAFQADSSREAAKKTNAQLIEAIRSRSEWRKQRVSELKEEMEKSSALGRERVRGLVNRLMAVLPDKVVRVGDTWKGSLASEVDMLPPMSGVYTLTAVEQNVCAIQALGRRGPDEDPFVEEEGPVKTISRLDGSFEASLQIDRRTGWLLHAEYRTNLHGPVTTTIAGPQPRDISDRISIETASTLTALK